ncbi:hypothetical protein CXF68_17740 [Tenacibaculum sp. Bg11-29]|uniref:DUF7151 family protein n=1 Tax=Tenacibaculum sp. Bg11-29 TaxID=2058306 RepID=UPI000C3254F1|nr:hypothetical protein [Tenacibaculum sp. Bg11-29]PKH52421.1 hypothetical protein CXF68_17740 [Tenacibaculum sp. Bg11-29]
MRKVTKIFLVLLITLIISCSGDDGTDGIDGLNSLIVTLIEQPGGNCSNGGFQIQSGIDLNSNNQLELTEVDNTKFICNGQNANLGFNRYVSLISQSGATNPTSAILENTLGLDISWIRESQGKYLGTLDTSIDINNSVIFYNTPSTHTGVRGEIVSSSQIRLELEAGINAFRDNFSNLSFELREYE